MVGAHLARSCVRPPRQEVLVREGLSKNGNYFTRRAVEDVGRLAEGARAFTDHATPTEDRGRPARSIRDVVGFYEQAGTAIEPGSGRLQAEAALYVDPYTALCLLEGVDLSLAAGEVLAAVAGAQEELAALRADRDFNYALKMRMEGYIRSVEGKRPRVLPGTADRLIAAG